jgi:molybdopterin biosynthesis enzyme
MRASVQEGDGGRRGAPNALPPCDQPALDGFAVKFEVTRGGNKNSITISIAVGRG